MFSLVASLRKTFNPFWFLWFSLCLIPFSAFGGSANYLFALTPLYFVFSGKKLLAPSEFIRFFFLCCVAIFCISLIYQYQFYDYLPKKFISAFLFVSIFSLSLCDFTKRMISSFFLALLFVSFCLALNSFYNLSLYNSLDVFSLKAEIGSQRVGFLYLFAFWILVPFLYRVPQSFLIKFSSLACLLVVFGGLVLTFSRSSYIGLLAGAVYSLCANFRLKLSFKSFLTFFAIAVFVCFLVFFVSFLVPGFNDFLNIRFFSLFNADYLATQLGDSSSSEGTRIEIWKTIINFVSLNPFTGTGFLGVWIFDKDLVGSSHNEFLDRLLRLGIFGFFVYSILLFKIFTFLSRFYPSLAVGFVSVMVYSLFHETFSLSQGSAVLSFFIMLLENNIRITCSSRQSLASSR